VAALHFSVDVLNWSLRVANFALKVSLEDFMRTRIVKWLSAGLTAMVLVAFAGCGGDKGPVRTVDDTKEQPKKNPDAR
jgi:hypothetical protein